MTTLSPFVLVFIVSLVRKYFNFYFCWKIFRLFNIVFVKKYKKTTFSETCVGINKNKALI